VTYEMVLKCRFCDLVPGADAEMGFVVEHMKAEHGGAKVAFEMLPRHECGTLCELVSSEDETAGRRMTRWRCPACRVLFNVYQRAPR
jgi:hypothetical protein